MAMQFADELSMRLEYYMEIKRYRKMLRKSAASTMGSPLGQLYDMNLKVKYEKEVKEFDMMDRNDQEVLMVLNKIKDELS
jgi:hypothetical protein